MRLTSARSGTQTVTVGYPVHGAEAILPDATNQNSHGDRLVRIPRARRSERCGRSGLPSGPRLKLGALRGPASPRREASRLTSGPAPHGKTGNGAGPIPSQEQWGRAALCLDYLIFLAWGIAIIFAGILVNAHAFWGFVPLIAFGLWRFRWRGEMSRLWRRWGGAA